MMVDLPEAQMPTMAITRWLFSTVTVPPDQMKAKGAAVRGRSAQVLRRNGQAHRHAAYGVGFFGFHAHDDHGHVVVGAVLVQAQGLGEHIIGDLAGGGLLVFEHGGEQCAQVERLTGAVAGIDDAVGEHHDGDTALERELGDGGTDVARRADGRRFSGDAFDHIPAGHEDRSGVVAGDDDGGRLQVGGKDVQAGRDLAAAFGEEVIRGGPGGSTVAYALGQQTDHLAHDHGGDGLGTFA